MRRQIREATQPGPAFPCYDPIMAKHLFDAPTGLFNATIFMAGIVASAIGLILNAAALGLIVIAGVFILIDPSYVDFFRPWVILSVIYIVVAITIIAYRVSPKKTVIVIEDNTRERQIFATLQHMRYLPTPTTRSRDAISWLMADGGIHFAEIAGFDVSVSPDQGLWRWLITKDGVIQAEGLAPSLADAESRIVAAMRL